MTSAFLWPTLTSHPFVCKNVQCVRSSVLNDTAFLYVALFNARCVCNKLPELNRLRYHENQDVILITETWLNTNFSDNLLDPESRYHIFRCDRDHQRGGGVCILVNRKLNALNAQISDVFSSLEILR